jgi:hypothetical protein
MAQARKRSNVYGPKKTSGRRPNGGRRPGAGRWGSAFIQCHICQHPERSRIGASGSAQRAVAAQFGLPKTSLNHHFKLHVSERYKAMVGASHIDSFETLHISLH